MNKKGPGRVMRPKRHDKSQAKCLAFIVPEVGIEPTRL